MRAGRLPRARGHVGAAAAGVAIAVGIAGCGSAEDEGDRAAPAPAPTTSTATQGPSSFADGSYRATGTYGGQPSRIGVTMELRDGVVAAVDVTTYATDPTSLDLQRRFAAAVPDVVVGRRIEDVRVSKLAGSSGTPQGFNAAVERIKGQARQ